MGNYWYCSKCNNRVSDTSVFCPWCHPEVELMEEVRDKLNQLIEMLDGSTLVRKINRLVSKVNRLEASLEKKSERNG